jgi:hypothetical protein
MFRTRLSGFIAISCSALLLVGISSATGATVKKNLALPKLPAMIGTAETVKVTPGRWNLKCKLSYQWLLDGAPVKKATSTSFVVPVTALSQRLSVIETAKFTDGKTKFVSTKSVLVGQMTTSGQTVLTKNDATSKLVLATPNLPKATATSAIRWYAGGSLMEGENTNEITIDKRLESLSVYAKVTYTNPGYNPLVLTSNSISFAAPGVTQNTLIWSDEFDGDVGSGPSVAAWNDVTGNGRLNTDPNTPVANGWGNKEREYYLPGASLIASMDRASNPTSLDGTTDGKGLLITATNQTLTPNQAGPFDCWYSLNWKGERYNPRKDCEWVSGKITTENKLGFLYGHLEAKIKTTGTAGTWPAFWMLGQDFQTNSWPGCGEIDIHEGNGAIPNSNWGTIHGYSYWPGGQKTQPASMLAGWHVYGLDWKPNYIAFSVDGEIYKIITANDLTTSWNLNLETNGWEFNKPQFAILNLAVGGTIIGNNSNPVRVPDINTDTKTMQIDYIRYSTLDGYGTLIRY